MRARRIFFIGTWAAVSLLAVAGFAAFSSQAPEPDEVLTAPAAPLNGQDPVDRRGKLESVPGARTGDEYPIFARMTVDPAQPWGGVRPLKRSIRSTRSSTSPMQAARELPVCSTCARRVRSTPSSLCSSASCRDAA